MTTWVSIGKDLYRAGDMQATIRPKNYRTGKPVVVFVHGRGGDARDALLYNRAKLAQLADLGYPVLSIDATGAATWGVDAAIASVGTAIAWARANLGASNAPAVLIAQSAGFLVTMGYAKTALADVACSIGLIPVCDLQDMVTNNRGGLASEINSKYSGGYSDATYGATHNPVVMAQSSGYGSLPVRIYNGTTDATAVPSTVTTLASRIGDSASTVSIAGGHAQSTVDAIDVSDLTAFVQAHS